MTPLNMSIFVTAHGPTGDDAPFIRFIESGTTRHTLSSIILIFQLSQILDDSASSSLVSAGSVFSELPTTSSVSPLSMKSFESSQSDDSQRSRSPSLLDRTSFYPKYYNPPTLVRPHIYKSTFASAQCRVPVGSLLPPFLDTPGTIWVNKIPQVDALCPVICRRHDQLALVRRPRGFGKTTFLSASRFIHDVLKERAVAHAFGPRALNFPDFQGDRLVMHVDLQAVFYDTSENMCSSANAYMNLIYHSFLRRYAEQLDLSDEDEILGYVDLTSQYTFDEILTLLTFSGHRLILLIDNFNFPLLKSTPQNCIAVKHVILDCITEPFRTALENGYVVGGAIMGRPIEEEPSWVRSMELSESLFGDIGCDVSDEEQARGAFGFTLSEVRALAAEALGEAEGIQFVDELKDISVYCSGDYVEYCMEEVLVRLRSLTGQSQPEHGWVVCGKVRGRLEPQPNTF
ncbi:hypothetical protein CPB85DRAFT_1303211 [Mucidula mucida]|nr:hypothetical protein CPB85DRAFT_1303211 [Mucidula mucida]